MRSKWLINSVSDKNLTTGRSFTTRWVASNGDGYEFRLQAHTKQYGDPGYYCSVGRGTSSLCARVHFPTGLMQGLRSGAVTLAECDDYLQSLLDDALRDALRQDMEMINADKARAWMELHAGFLLRFYAPSSDVCQVHCWTDDDGTMIARESHATDEGSEARRVEAQPLSDGTWALRDSRWSRDCDGPLEHHWEGIVADGKITETDAWQRDAYAEAMGY